MCVYIYISFPNQIEQGFDCNQQKLDIVLGKTKKKNPEFQREARIHNSFVIENSYIE